MKPWHLTEQNLPFLVEQMKEKLKSKKRIKVIITEDDDSRSNEQNERLWGFLYKSIGSYFGYTQDEMHQLMKYKFLRSERIINGESVEVIKSTTKLSVKEMNDYQNQIEIWASQMGWSDHG